MQTPVYKSKYKIPNSEYKTAKILLITDQKMARGLPIDPETGLDERQTIAAYCLAQGKSCREAAKQAGVSERWLYAWRKRPEMQREITSRQWEMLDDAGGLNTSYVQKAVYTLNEIVTDPEARASDRIQAARALMSGSSAFAERKLLERKLGDLERQLSAGLDENKKMNGTPQIEESALIYAGNSEDE
jgi:transposase-like protein